MTLSRRQQIRARTDGLSNIRECLNCHDLCGVSDVTCPGCGWLLVTRPNVVRPGGALSK